MFKKHALSEHHKVVTSSKHNFHPNGTEPTTASSGGAPQELHGGADGPAAAGEGTAGPVESFCNGGMKYDDGGVVDKAAEIVSRGADKLFNSAANQYDTAHTKQEQPLAASEETQKSSPGAGFGGEARVRATLKQADDMS